MEAFTSPAEILPLPSPLFDFTTARPRLDKIINEWSGPCLDAGLRRKERYVDIDVEGLRQSGEIDEDETLVPDRVIDSNIGREKADAMGFLNAGFRLAVFDCVTDPSQDCRDHEIQFTKGLTYDGWYPEFDSWEDGAELHGMSYMEVTLDTSKPLFVGFEYIPFDKLFYGRKVRNIQQSEFLVRKFEINIFTLEGWKDKYQFDPEQIQNIVNDNQDRARDRDIEVFRVYFKAQGQVFVAWYCKLSQARGWLKEPSPLNMGIIDLKTMQPIPLQDYPIFPRVYKPDENEMLVDHKGRGFLDGPQQEANTCIISAYVNNLSRSSNYYASPKNPDDSSSEMKELDTKLTPGSITSQPLEFWSLPAPDVMTLQAVSFFDSRNAMMQGKTAFTVVNRKDSRKTKKELQLAESDQNKITSTGLANFSSVLRSILSFAWRIVQSQALLDRIVFLQVPVQGVSPTLQPTVKFVNDKVRLAMVYDIRPAGDTDILQADAEIQKYLQDWPVMQTTPLKDQFLQDFIKLRYPKKASEYVKILQQGNPAKGLVAGLGTVLKQITQEHPEVVQQLAPKDLQGLQQLEQQATAFLQQP